MGAVLAACLIWPAAGSSQKDASGEAEANVGVGIYVDQIENVDTATEGFTAVFDLAFACRSECERLGEGWEVSNGEVASIERRTRSEDFVSYRVRADLEGDFDISGFPFDEQQLPIQISAITNDIAEDRYAVDQELAGVRSDLEISGWTLAGSEATATAIPVPQEDAEYASVTFALDVERIDRIAVLKYLLPVVVMLVLNLIQVLASTRISPKDRVPLASAGVLLAIVTFIASLSELPEKTGLTFLDGFTILSILLFIAMLVEPLYEMTMVDANGKDIEDFRERRTRINRAYRIAAPVVVVLAYGLLFVIGP